MKKIEEKNTEDSKGGACVLSQPLPDSTCVYASDQNTAASRIKDENRDTERLSILPHLTQLLGSGLRTGPVWSNLESRCCDDPEGAAETRWPMASQVRPRTHTRSCGLHL